MLHVILLTTRWWWIIVVLGLDVGGDLCVCGGSNEYIVFMSFAELDTVWSPTKFSLRGSVCVKTREIPGGVI